MKCKNCNTEKLAADFYASNKTQCKECVKAAVIKNRIAKIEYYRSYDKFRASMPHRVAARTEYQKTPAGIASHVAASERWAANHPERRKASFAVSNAVRDGKLFKTPCQVCGIEKVEGHHPDYSRPLDVVWLCTPHHKEIHRMTA